MASKPGRPRFSLLGAAAALVYFTLLVFAGAVCFILAVYTAMRVLGVLGIRLPP